MSQILPATAKSSGRAAALSLQRGVCGVAELPDTVGALASANSNERPLTEPDGQFKPDPGPAVAPRSPESERQPESGSTGHPIGETFEVVANAFRQTPLRRKVWENQTALQAREIDVLFAETTGNRPLAEYGRGDAVGFKKRLSDLLADYAKAAKSSEMATAEIVRSTKDQDVLRLTLRMRNVTCPARKP